MAEVKEINNRAALIALIKAELDPFSPVEHPLAQYDRVTLVKPYGWDERIGWETHIVLVSGYGVFGFTDGPLEE
ncbi:hypothetical protein CC53_gp108 [Rhizobium phage vB_RleS_L338C]|uniref:hypothetical protein n=1 Tax=Rhizobium phage vB_RleS_L338C TaxID=1414737 RepID=UPI0003D8D63D|nr:hypothetical protein CC53_gp108 [Rhizobium phage vB_RleS_L338C]AHC30525.1 hypothetical protein L338C_108 [Rhizobium phage vB_RleS_L338C]